MTQWVEAGNYLGKNVQIIYCDQNNCAISGKSFTDSLLLVMLGTRFDDNETCRRFLSDLIASEPLAIVLFGLEARRAFDLLIDVLSHSHLTRHVMTKLIEGPAPDEAILDFLHATWPAEEQFDNWKKYSVILTGEFQEPVTVGIIKSVCR